MPTGKFLILRNILLCCFFFIVCILLTNKEGKHMFCAINLQVMHKLSNVSAINEIKNNLLHRNSFLPFPRQI